MYKTSITAGPLSVGWKFSMGISVFKFLVFQSEFVGK